jgi:hypothetical protein
MYANLRKEFSDPPTDLHELQAQGVQLHPLYAPIHQLLPQSVHKPVGSSVHKQTKLVGHKAVAAEAIGFERYLQILDPILCLATLSVMSVEFIGLIGFVSHHKAGALVPSSITSAL